GPLGNLADGIDISLPITLGLASLMYLALLSLFPETPEVYGPDDARSQGLNAGEKPALRQPA
ncbi:cytosine permease, partial [Pseudomonas gingeri]|nr:cytosine permease [Pseudomonas gingeri]